MEIKDTKKATRELTEMQKAFLAALFSPEAKGKPHIAKKMAGYTDSTTSGDLIKSLGEEIVEETKKFLAGNSSQAAFALINVLEDPSAAGTSNLLKAASEILDRVGVKEKNLEVQPLENGLVILPQKNARVAIQINVD